jgi:peptide-methionine (S)-S-oxide reductase
MAALMAARAPAADGQRYQGVGYFSMGCFWSGEIAFECAHITDGRKYLGVASWADLRCSTLQHTVSDKTCVPLSTVVGYMGGTGVYPTYTNYTTRNNYSETVRVEYNTSELSFDDLLDIFWKYAEDIYDPPYDPAYEIRVFATDNEQLAAASASLARLKANSTQELFATVYNASAYTFWKAEEYHQQYDFKAGFTCQGHPPLGVRRG